MRIIFGSIILFLAVRIWAVGTDDDGIESISIQAPGPVSDVRAADLNGDGSLDLLVMHGDSTGNPARMISFFLRNADGFGAPSVSLQSNACIYDLADVDGDKAEELVLLNESAIRWFDWNNGSLMQKTIHLEFSAFFPVGCDRMVHWPLAVDMDDGSRNELAVPKSDGIALMRIDSTGVLSYQLIETEPASTIDDRTPFRWTTEVPNVSAQDFNGDGQADLISTLGDRLDVFLMHLSGIHELSGISVGNACHGLNPLLPDFRYRMAYHGLDSDILKLDLEETRLDVRDLDRDGRADLIVSRRSRLDFTNRMSAVGIHFNKRGRIDPIPDQVITKENLGASYSTGDWNGDGKIDLAIPRLKIGIELLTRILLTRKVSASIDIYCLDKNGRYPDNPDAVLDFTVKPVIRDWLQKGFVKTEGGDWNGDGKADLFVETGDSKRLVFLQLENLEFDREPLELPASGYSAMVDLYRNGSDELLLWNDGSPEIRIIRNSAR